GNDGVLHRQAPASVTQRRCGFLAWKLRKDYIVIVMSERAPKAHVVFARGVEMQIDFSNKGAIVTMARSVEAKAAEIQSTVLAISWIITGGILIHDGQHAGVHADIQGIDQLHLGRRERLS